MQSNNNKKINKKNWRKPRPPLPPRPPPPNPPNPTTNAVFQFFFRFTLKDFFKKCVLCCPPTNNQSHIYASN